MPRVAFLLPDFRMGGAERVALSLIESFIERGLETDLVLMRAEGELLASLPAEVRVQSLEVSKIRRAIRPFASYLRERRPAAVQVRMWPLTLIPLIARRLARVPTRVVTSDDAILSESYADHGLLHDLLLRSSIGLGYPHAEGRVAVSQGAARDLAALGRLDPASVSVILNPVSVLEPAADEHPDWGGEGARILAVGTLKPVKNHALLLNAFARLAERRSARLVILGEGVLRPELEGLAERLGIRDRLLMPGTVNDPSPYYASADVMALSSDHEGYGNVLVEALHHGLTIVSTDCPAGPGEILDGGRYGYLVPCGDVDAFADGLQRACEAPLPSQQLRDRAKQLSGPHIVDAYLSLLLPDFRA